MLWFLLKFSYTESLIRYHDAETAGFLNRYRHTGNGHIRLICLVEVEHNLVIHLIYMIS